MLRTLATWFVALLAYGYAWFLAEDWSVPHWAVALGFVVVGAGLQLVYARLVNTWFNEIGLDGTTRARLRSDRGVVPIWIAGLGIAARVCLIAGVVFPLLEAVGWLGPETVRPG